MERIAVQSRDIALVGYDSETTTLEVTFRAGGVYQYIQVPEKIHREFLAASSIGTFFRDNIRERYSYKKVSG